MRSVDVVVVGGGMAGVSIAYELSAELSVLLLEREAELAHHTTGRSAAAFIESYGPPVVRALTRASRGSYHSAPSDLGTPPLLTPRPMLWVARDDQQAALAGLVDGLSSSSGVSVLSADAALDVCPGLDRDVLAAAAIDTSAMDIDVMALHQGYVTGLRRRGGEVLRGSVLRGLRRRATSWDVETDGELVSTAVVVDAAGAWADQVASLAGVPAMGLRPLQRTIAICSGTRSDDISGWPLVVDVDEQFYFKPESGGQVLVSPADETPVEPGDARPRDEDVALGIERVNAATTLALRHVRSAWAGLRTFGPDRRPVVGFDPQADGFFWYAGQGGYGIQMAPALARFGAALVGGRALAPDLLDHGLDVDALSPSRSTVDDVEQPLPGDDVAVVPAERP